MTTTKRFGGQSSEPVVGETPAVVVAATEARVYRQLFDREPLADYLDSRREVHMPTVV